MKYLKFMSKRNMDSLGDYFKLNFSFVIGNSADEIIKADNECEKSISIKLSGREDASLRAQYKNYELDRALFEIAKNYLVKKISERKEIKEKEELLLDAWKYLNLETEPLVGFHTEIIKIEE